MPRTARRIQDRKWVGVLVCHLLNPLSLVPFKKGRLRGGPSRIGARGAYLAHSTRFLTRPVSRIFAAFASEGLP
jgi:hypothetical protein